MERGPITVACNLANQARRIPLRDGARVLLLGANETTWIANDAVGLDPDTVAILKPSA